MSDREALAMGTALQSWPNPREAKAIKKEISGSFDAESFLKDLPSEQRNFKKRDAADLFSASALANDKDGKLTEYRISLPSAFYLREEIKDSAHAALEKSDSTSISDAANQFGSAPGSADSEMCVESDPHAEESSTRLFRDCVTEDLDLVENAILRMLRKDVRLSSKHYHEDATKLKDASELDEHLERSGGPQEAAGDVELQLLAKLLDQVQILRDQKSKPRQNSRTGRALSRSGRSVRDATNRNTGRERRLRKDDLKKAVEGATQAAKAAAEAARTAAILVNQNSDAMNKVLQSLSPSYFKSPNSHSKSNGNGPHRDSSTLDSSSSSDSEVTTSSKDMVKKIVSQNRYTHVLLGIMFVSSFVWRYIVVKVAKRVRTKVSEPWGYISGHITDGFKGPEKGKQLRGEGESSGGSLSVPQLSLPPILGGPERQEDVVANPTNATEERLLSFGKVLQIKPNRGE